MLSRSEYEEVLQMRRELAALRDDLHRTLTKSYASKAGFNDDQPRWPKRSGKISGRWSGGPGTGGVRVTTSPGFLTGISTIDDTSKKLSDTLVRVMEKLNFIPESTSQAYGIAVHTAFAAAVRLQNLPGIGLKNVERSFSLEDSDPRYGLAGSIRTDVALQNDQGEVIAIYDVKTGERPLSHSRANELREKTGASPDTPVFELNVVRGISKKYRQIGLELERWYSQLAARRI